MSRHVIQSGIPGVFYRRPGPGEPVFVEENQRVEAGDTVGLVEIMKSFHPVVADVSGTLTRFLTEHEAEVVPGQEIAEVAEDRLEQNTSKEAE